MRWGSPRIWFPSFLLGLFINQFLHVKFLIRGGHAWCNMQSSLDFRLAIGVSHFTGAYTFTRIFISMHTQVFNHMAWCFLNKSLGGCWHERWKPVLFIIWMFHFLHRYTIIGSCLHQLTTNFPSYISSAGRIRNSFKPCHTHFLVVFTSVVCKWGLGAFGVTSSSWKSQEGICCHTGGEGGRRWLSLAQSDGRAPPRCATCYHICGALHKACAVASPPGWMRLTGWGSSRQPRALPRGSWWPPHNWD